MWSKQRDLNFDAATAGGHFTISLRGQWSEDDARLFDAHMNELRRSFARSPAPRCTLDATGYPVQSAQVTEIQTATISALVDWMSLPLDLIVPHALGRLQVRRVFPAGTYRFVMVADLAAAAERAPINP